MHPPPDSENARESSPNLAVERWDASDGSPALIAIFRRVVGIRWRDLWPADLHALTAINPVCTEMRLLLCRPSCRCMKIGIQTVIPSVAGCQSDISGSEYGDVTALYLHGRCCVTDIPGWWLLVTTATTAVARTIFRCQAVEINMQLAAV